MAECDNCKGSGRVIKTDIIKARTVEERCPACNGTGQKDGIPPDCIYVKPDPGVLHYFFKLIGGRRVCVIQTIIEKVLPQNGIIQKAEAYFIVSILNMNTRNKDRKKGYASEVIEHIKRWNRNTVKFIITSWDSSAEESRRLLIKLGFERENAVLIWRRKDGAEKLSTEEIRQDKSGGEAAGIINSDATNNGTGTGLNVAEAGGDSTDSKTDEAGVHPELGDNPQGTGCTPEAGAGGPAQPGEPT